MAVLLFAIAMFGGYLDQQHSFYHVHAARITSAAWGSHEVKNCASWNARTDPVVLECDGGHTELQESVAVRFYGDVRRPLDRETLRFYWNCQKSEGARHAVSCRISSQP
jgi:hypothetical protein